MYTAVIHNKKYIIIIVAEQQTTGMCGYIKPLLTMHGKVKLDYIFGINAWQCGYLLTHVLYSIHGKLDWLLFTNMIVQPIHFLTVR